MQGVRGHGSDQCGRAPCLRHTREACQEVPR